MEFHDAKLGIESYTTEIWVWIWIQPRNSQKFELNYIREINDHLRPNKYHEKFKYPVMTTPQQSTDQHNQISGMN